MRVQLVSDTDLPAWQAFVDGNESSGCMHHAGWYGVLREACWVTPYFLMAINAQGAIEGILPTYLSRSPLTGRHLSSLEDGVLAATAEAASALLTEARSLRDQTGSRYLQIRGGAIDRPAEVIHSTVHTLVATSEPVEKLWSGITQQARRAVRKAEQQDLNIEHDASLAKLNGFHTVYAAHMRDLGTPVIGADMFDAMITHLGRERLRLYLVKHAGRLIGGMLCIVNGRRWTDYYTSVRRSPDTNFANYLLHWRVICDAASCGVERFDLGRSTPGSNVHVFKQKWRGTDIEVPYHFYLRSGARRGNLGFSRQKRDKSMLQKCWSTLPLSISNRIGPLIRKQLPFI
jgi:hypothetical protein